MSIYNVETLSSILEEVFEDKTVYVRTQWGAVVINGHEIDEDGDVILLTEKMD